MMDYDHSPHSYNAVKNIKTPQSVGVDAASSVTKNGRFCGVGQQFDILIHNSFTVGWRIRKDKRRKERTSLS